jgi:hypothetical protein
MLAPASKRAWICSFVQKSPSKASLLHCSKASLWAGSLSSSFNFVVLLDIFCISADQPFVSGLACPFAVDLLEAALLLISEAALLLISEAALLLISWKPHY